MKVILSDDHSFSEESKGVLRKDDGWLESGDLENTKRGETDDDIFFKALEPLRVVC